LHFKGFSNVDMSLKPVTSFQGYRCPTFNAAKWDAFMEWRHQWHLEHGVPMPPWAGPRRPQTDGVAYKRPAAAPCAEGDVASGDKQEVHDQQVSEASKVGEESQPAPCTKGDVASGDKQQVHDQQVSEASEVGEESQPASCTEGDVASGDKQDAHDQQVSEASEVGEESQP
jgi:hypothetical protein